MTESILASVSVSLISSLVTNPLEVYFLYIFYELKTFFILKSTLINFKYISFRKKMHLNLLILEKNCI